jgi:hypothetical protein
MPHLFADVWHMGPLGLGVGVRAAAAGVVVVPTHGELHRHGVRAEPERARVRARPLPLDERHGDRRGRVAHGRVLRGRSHVVRAAVHCLAFAGARDGRLPRQLRVWAADGVRGETETAASIRAEHWHSTSCAPCSCTGWIAGCHGRRLPWP